MSVPPPPAPPLPPSPKPEVGQTIAGKYRLDRILGEGGMGIVFAAMHVELDQPVALKFMLSGLGDPAAKARFVREARSVVKLRGEHVARVLDVGSTDGGGSYMVMEYLEGADLSELVKGRGSFPIEEATEYILQAAEGLAEAHAIGIVHRDLKPANLFLTRSPSGLPLLKVLDFGISKINAPGAGLSDVAPDSQKSELTKTAVLLGSPRYMAPEQMRSAKDVDGRADIWSLGVLLYRFVGGNVPFDGESLGALLATVMHDPLIQLRTLKPEVPMEFSAIVARCLEKRPADRFPDLGDLAVALEPFAPTRMRGTAARIEMVLRASKLARQAVPPVVTTAATAETPPVAASAVPHSTAGGTAVAAPAPAAKSRAMPIAFAGLVLIAAAAGLWKVRSRPVADLPPPAPLEVVKASAASGAIAEPAPMPTMAAVMPKPDDSSSPPTAGTPTKADASAAVVVDSEPVKRPKSDAGARPGTVARPSAPKSAQPAAPSSPAMMDAP